MQPDSSRELRVKTAFLIALRVAFAAVILISAVGLAALIYARGPARQTAEHRAYGLAGSGRPAEAVALYSQQIAGDPDNFVLYLRRGLTFQRLKQYEQALADFNQAVRLNPSTQTAEGLGPRVWDSASPETHQWTLSIQAHTARAEVLMALDRLDEALADLDHAVAANIRNLGNRHQRAVLRMLSGRHDEAIVDFDVILRRGPNQEALFARGLAKYLKHDWGAAAADFQAVARLSPNNRKFAEWLEKSRAYAAQPTRVEDVQMPREDIVRTLRPASPRRERAPR